MKRPSFSRVFQAHDLCESFLAGVHLSFRAEGVLPDANIFTITLQNLSEHTNAEART